MKNILILLPPPSQGKKDPLSDIFVLAPLNQLVMVSGKTVLKSIKIARNMKITRNSRLPLPPPPHNKEGPFLTFWSQ